MKNSPKCLICLKHEKDYNYSLQVYFNYVIRLGKAVGLTLLFSTKLSFYFHSNSLTKAKREWTRHMNILDPIYITLVRTNVWTDEFFTCATRRTFAV